MDQFKLKKAYLISKCMGAGYPLIAIIGLLVIISGEFMELSEKGPLILLGLFSWFGYEVWNTSKYFKYQISINDTEIQINTEAAIPWSKIAKAQINGIRFGMDPVIILTTQDDHELKIPATINGLHYIKGFVEKNVSDIQIEGA